MSNPDMKIVKENLEPIEPDIYEAFHDAWKDYCIIKKLVPILETRTRATIVNELARRKLINLLSEKPGVVIEESHESALFTINDIVSFKLKKGDGLGKSRSYRTQRAVAYHNHDEGNILWPQLNRVESQYVLDGLATELKSIYIVAQDESNNPLWKYPIMSDSIPLYQPQLPFPTLPFPTQPTTPPSDMYGPLEDLLPKKDENKGE